MSCFRERAVGQGGWTAKCSGPWGRGAPRASLGRSLMAVTLGPGRGLAGARGEDVGWVLSAVPVPQDGLRV